ncbi:unnamed protein product [Cutaneotrichosporon oleaginosum]
MSFGGAVWTKIRLDSFDSLREALYARRRRPMTFWLSTVMGANIVLCAAVLHGLIREWDQWALNENWISRGARLVLESQLPATTVSIAFLIQIRVRQGSFIGSTFYGIQSNVYLVGLMFSLNGRLRYAAGDVKGDTSEERNATTAAATTIAGQQPITGANSQLSHRNYATAPTTPYRTPSGDNRSSGSTNGSVEGADITLHAVPAGNGGEGGSDSYRQEQEVKSVEGHHEREQSGGVGRSSVGSVSSIPKPLRR